jgi:membrane-bound lytic murein transglycosylase
VENAEKPGKTYFPIGNALRAAGIIPNSKAKAQQMRHHLSKIFRTKSNLIDFGMSCREIRTVSRARRIGA